jgi:hypothetical protein
MSFFDRFSRDYYLDAMGDVRTALTTTPAWTTEALYFGTNNTGMIIPFMRHDQADEMQIILQFNHNKNLQTNISDLHIHYIPMATNTTAVNVNFTVTYGWFGINDILGATNVTNFTTTFTSVPIAANNGDLFKHKIAFLLGGGTNNAGGVSSIAAPVNESYSSIFMAKITRLTGGTNNTYTTDKLTTGGTTAQANFGVLYVDAHYPVNRLGSYSPTT